jgi:hypothetical protein
MFIDAISRARKIERLIRIADLRAVQLSAKEFAAHLKDIGE